MSMYICIYIYIYIYIYILKYNEAVGVTLEFTTTVYSIYWNRN